MSGGREVRGLLLSLFLQWEKTGEAAQRLLEREGQALERARDRAFLRKVFYGVLENLRYLDFLLDQISKKPMARQKPRLRYLLRMGLYDLHFLKTPAYVLDSYVGLAGKVAPYAKNYVNALFRAYLRGQAKEIAVVDKESLFIRYSVPDWMGEKLLESFSLEEVQEILARNNESRGPGIFVAPKITRDQAMEALSKEHIQSIPSTISPYALRSQGGMVSQSTLFQEGLLSIQSPSSILAAQKWVEGLEEEEGRILDLCAAPGSKSMVAKLLAPQMEVFSNDVEAKKLVYIEENAKRMGIPLFLSARDGREEVSDWLGAFDAVLVDAPCSGLGLLGHKPDIRWMRKPEDLPSLASLQKELLAQAGKYVKEGGRLVYSTCTYGREENEDVVQTLLSQGFSYEDPEAIHLSPLDEGTDGFFIARLRKGLSAHEKSML